jgi:hypothetical protein
MKIHSVVSILLCVLVSQVAIAKGEHCDDGLARIAVVSQAIIQGNGSPAVCDSYQSLLQGLLNIADQEGCDTSPVQSLINRAQRICEI